MLAFRRIWGWQVCKFSILLWLVEALWVSQGTRRYFWTAWCGGR